VTTIRNAACVKNNFIWSREFVSTVQVDVTCALMIKFAPIVYLDLSRKVGPVRNVKSLYQVASYAQRLEGVTIVKRLIIRML